MPVEKTRDYVDHITVHKQKYQLEWELSAFDEIPFIPEHPIPSPSFVLGDGLGSIWHLLFSKEMKEKEPEKRHRGKSSSPVDVDAERPLEKAIGFRLIKIDDTSLWEVVHYHVQIKAGDLTVKSKILMESGNSFYDTEVIAYISESDMEGDLFKAETIQITVLIDHLHLDYCPLDISNLSARQFFQNDLIELYNTKKFADVILEAGDTEILAHKSVLCAKSYGLDCKLQDDPERMKPNVELYLDEILVKAMMSYIYSCGLPFEFTLDKCPALYEAAKKYDVHGLDKAISDYFNKNMDSEVCRECLGIKNEEDIPRAFLIPEQKLKAILSKQDCVHKGELSG